MFWNVRQQKSIEGISKLVVWLILMNIFNPSYFCSFRFQVSTGNKNQCNSLHSAIHRDLHWRRPQVSEDNSYCSRPSSSRDLHCGHARERSKVCNGVCCCYSIVVWRSSLGGSECDSGGGCSSKYYSECHCNTGTYTLIKGKQFPYRVSAGVL